MEWFGRPPGPRWALIVLILLGFSWPLAPAGAQPSFCPRPFVDREREIICSFPESRNSERRLFNEHRALTQLLHADDVAELEREQAEWRQKRRADCEARPSNEEPDCYAEWAADRASLLHRQVDYVIKDGLAALSLRDLHLDVRWIVDRNNDGAIVTQLRLGKRVLAEAHGPNRFDVLARAGNDDAEAIVVRADKEGGTYAIVGRKDAPAEIWQVRSSRPWMTKPPMVAAEGERLEIREPAEADASRDWIVDSTARLQWTPSTGWRIAEPYRSRPPIPRPSAHFGGTGSRSDCKSTFETQETVKFGNRSLTVGREAASSRLVFGCDTLIEAQSFFDLTAERQIGTASVMLSTEHNYGNLGVVDRHILADIPGHGILVWAVPGAEVATSFGYLFLSAAEPGLDGGIYRWTPWDGFTFEGYQVFTPSPDSTMRNVGAPKVDEGSELVTANLLTEGEVYRAFEVASGPSFFRLAFDLVRGGAWSRSRLERQWAPELVVFTDCDGSRFCNNSGGKMIGVFVKETRRLYFAFPHDRARDPKDGSASGRRLVWEYHPPLAQWPQEAVAAVEVLYGDQLGLGAPDND
jgi:hypothetical protein